MPKSYQNLPDSNHCARAEFTSHCLHESGESMPEVVPSPRTRSRARARAAVIAISASALWVLVGGGSAAAAELDDLTDYENEILTARSP
jgi:hypothetical protein